VATSASVSDESTFDLLQADDPIATLSRLSLTLYRVFLVLGAAISVVFGIWYAWTYVGSNASFALLIDFGCGIAMFLFSLGGIWTQESRSPRSVQIAEEGLRLQFRTRSPLLIPWPSGDDMIQILDYPKAPGSRARTPSRLIRLYVDPRWSVGLTVPAFEAIVRRANEIGFPVDGRLVEAVAGREAHRLVLIRSKGGKGPGA
jgi:hypothetical protein